MKLVIFGCGNIANRIAKGALMCDNVELVGFGSRDIEKAKSYSLKYNCKEYGTYDYFLNSDIDAVYVATYNINHYELVKKCIEANKNVICEKPMFSSQEEIDEMFDLANKHNVCLMEAMKSVFLPIIIKIKQMINSGLLGDICFIEANFARNSNFNKDHWINDLKTGGALKDVGLYCASVMSYILDTKPKITYKYKNTSDVSDNFAQVCLDYNGIKAHMIASNSTTLENNLTISGTKGYIKVKDYWKTGTGYYVIDNQRHEIKEEMVNDFYYEIKHFANLVENKQTESPIMNKQFTKDLLDIVS